MTLGFWVYLETLEPVVISAASATQGSHTSLDYIPGSTLRGYAAARLHGSLSEKAYAVFHSGQLRFGNAYPVDQGMQAIPVPLSFHYPKADKDFSDKGYAAIRNLLRDKALDQNNQSSSQTETTQLEQLRNCYLNGNGGFVRPTMTATMKTAINPASGVAADGSLFTYQAIAQGQKYAAYITFDDELSSEAETIRELFNQTNIWVGRSKSAEFGAVQAAVSSIESNDNKTEIAPHNGETTIYCLSECILDNCGATFDWSNLATLLGHNGDVVWEKSHLRYRRYSPYNAKLRCYERERLAIEAGSVFVLSGDNSIARSFIGKDIHSGFGEILINPDFLNNYNVENWQNRQIPQQNNIEDQNKAPIKDHKNAIILSLANLRSKANKNFDPEVEIYVREIEKMYEVSRELNAIQDGVLAGPSASQWARVHQALKGSINGDAALKSIENIIQIQTSEGKKDDPDWAMMTCTNADTYITYGKWLESFLQTKNVNPRFAAEVTKKAASLAKKLAHR
jgi:CRISPR-associated protein Csx10